MPWHLYRRVLPSVRDVYQAVLSIVPSFKYTQTKGRRITTLKPRETLIYRQLFKKSQEFMEIGTWQLQENSYSGIGISHNTAVEEKVRNVDSL